MLIILQVISKLMCAVCVASTKSFFMSISQMIDLD